MTEKADDRSPATLFLRYWRLAATWTASQRTMAPRPDAHFHAMCLLSLNADDAAKAHDEIETFVEAKSMADEMRRGRVLAAMTAIDDAFYAIHPRALAATTSTGGSVVPPVWLRDLRSDRAASGEYACDDAGRLVPRGPLLRAPRNPEASSGDLLADRYAALTVVPRDILHDGRRIPIAMPVVPIAAGGAGVSFSPSAGREVVGFAPLATLKGQIKTGPTWHDGRMYANYEPAATFDAAAAAMAAMAGLVGADMLVMPELVLSEAHVDTISSSMAALTGPRPRLVVAGSNLTSERADDLAFNETRVMNGRGVALWRQRKLWTAGTDRISAIAFGLPDPGAGSASVLENTACGDELVVADVDGFGRCVVLICQDVVTPSLAAETIDRFQPDWVFVPIFATFLTSGRWAHSRAFGLSEHSQARFIAITNTSFAGAPDAKEPKGMGFAAGPKEPANDADEKRVFAIVPQPQEGAAQWDRLQWRHGTWRKSTLDAK